MSPPQKPLPVPRATVASAVGALTKWMKKRAAEAPPNLLADERDDFVILQLTLRRIPASPATKPRLLPLPHPVIGHAGASLCIISDDRPTSRSPPAADLLDKSKSLDLPVSEVIPLSKLRTDYRPYESRRRLAGSYDLFIADRDILPLLPRVLGKAFYSTKKAPIGVKFSRVGWPDKLRMVMGSAFLYLGTGTCSGIKVGRLDMEEEEIVENVIAAVDAAVEHVPKKWANVRALHLKAVDSVALPIYQVIPQLGIKIEVPPVARLEGEAVDPVEAPMISNNEEVLGDSDREVSKEKSGKSKRNKKKQTEDVVMQEEVLAEPPVEPPLISNNEEEVLGDSDREEVSKERSGKRKRNKKKQTEDVVMQEEVQAEPPVESPLISNNEKDVLRDSDRGEVSKEKSGKRKRNKKKQTGDVVMQEEVLAESEKKSRSTVEGKKVGKKGKHGLEEAVAKKGRKSEPVLEEVSSTEMKGNKEDTEHELEDDVVDVANIKNKKTKKKNTKRGDDFVESLGDKKGKRKK